MELYLSRAKPTRVLRWDGTPNDPALDELRALGMTVVFQVSTVDTETDWDENEKKEIEVPAQGRLAIVGKYNWDTWHIAPGHHVRVRLVSKTTGKDLEWNDENLESERTNGDAKFQLGDVDDKSLDEFYDLVG